LKISLIIFFLFTGCSNFNSSSIDKNQILATIDSRIITVSDFIKRAEYNVRPSYCSGNTIQDKQIILNSLIAEKLFALNFNSNLENSHYQLLEGRKEQKMREVFYNRDIYNSIKIDSIELSRAFLNSFKEFNISYISVPQKELLVETLDLINSSLYTLEEIAKTYFNIDVIPQKKIKFDNNINQEMYKSFFSENIEVGNIYGPILMDDYYSIFRVDNWKETRNLSNVNINNDFSYFKKKIKDFKSQIKYRQYINSIMNGKKMEIHSENFEKLIKNIHSDIENIEINNSEYKLKDFSKNKNFTDNLKDNDIICKLSGENWTVKDFNTLISKNPITINPDISLFKLKKILKKIIINKLEIHYLTEEAYRIGLDQHYLVKHEEDVWSDYIKSAQVINNISTLSEVNSKNYNFIESILNPIVDSLINVNSKNIIINKKYFSNIDLTSIDMHVLFKEQSNKLVVPLFPMITSKPKQVY